MKGRKILAMLLTLAMVFSTISMGALAAEDNGVMPISETEQTAPIGSGYGDAADSWAAKSIERWSAVGIVKGDGKGNFNPSAQLSRAELAQIFVNMFGLTEKADNTFADLKGTEWYADAILKCAAAGIIKGAGANANAESIISRQETVVMFGRAVGVTPDAKPDLSKFSDASSVAGWAAGYVAPLAKMGILSGGGDGAINATGEIDRASTMSLLDKSVAEYVNAPGEYKVDNANGFVVVNMAAKEGEIILSGTTAGVAVSAGTAEGKIIAKDLKAETIKVDGAAALNVEGKSSVGEVVANATGTVTIAKGVTVDTVTANAPATIANSGTIKELTANAPAKVDNQGTITKADVKADGVVLDGKKPADVNVAEGTKNPTNSKGEEVKPNPDRPSGGNVTPPLATNTTISIFSTYQYLKEGTTYKGISVVVVTDENIETKTKIAEEAGSVVVKLYKGDTLLSTSTSKRVTSQIFNNGAGTYTTASTLFTPNAAYPSGSWNTTLWTNAMNGDKPTKAVVELKLKDGSVQTVTSGALTEDYASDGLPVITWNEVVKKADTATNINELLNIAAVTNVTLSGDATVNDTETLTIPAGKTLTIPAGTTLTIATGGMLAATGTGKAEVSGSVVSDAGYAAVEGIFTAAGAQFNVGSTLTIFDTDPQDLDSDTYIGTNSLNITTGHVTVSKAGGVSGFVLTIPAASEATISGPCLDNTDSAYRPGKNNKYIVEGKLTVGFDTKVAGILEVAEGGTLTVNADKLLEVVVTSGGARGSLTVNGEINNNGSIVGTGTINGTGDIWNAYGSSALINGVQVVGGSNPVFVLVDGTEIHTILGRAGHGYDVRQTGVAEDVDDASGKVVTLLNDLALISGQQLYVKNGLALTLTSGKSITFADATNGMVIRENAKIANVDGDGAVANLDVTIVNNEIGGGYISVDASGVATLIGK